MVISQIPCITSFLYFSLDAYLSINGKSLTEAVRKYRKIAYALTALLLISLVCYGGNTSLTGSLLYPFFIGTGVISLINLAVDISKRHTFEIKDNMSGLCFLYFFLIRLYCHYAISSSCC